MAKKKSWKKYKQYAPLMVLLFIPLIIGVVISFGVKNEVKLINRRMALAGLEGELKNVSSMPGFFTTTYDFVLKLTDSRTVVPFSFKISNLPSMDYIPKGQIRFSFNAVIPTFQYKKEVKGKNLKFDFENVVITGGYVLPKGIDAEGNIASISEKSFRFNLKDTKLDLSSRQGEWLATAHAKEADLRAFETNMDLRDIKFTMNGDSNRETNDYGFTIGLTIKVPSHTETDLKFNFGGTIHNIPHDLDVIEREGLKAYSDSQSSFDVSAALSIGKPAFRSIAKGSALKDGLEVEGALDINIPEAYQKDKIIAPIVAYLNSHAHEFKEFYGVDLNQLKVKVPFNVKQKKLMVNGKRFFTCDPPMARVTKTFSIEDLIGVSVEKAKQDAIEDLLSEEIPDRLAESYCRLKYAHEFGKTPDPSLQAMMTLLKVRGRYDVKMSIEDKEADREILTSSKAALANDEELVILAEEFYCYLDAHGIPCVTKEDLGTPHPFRKLLALSEWDSVEPLMVAGLVPPENTPQYLVHGYHLLQTKILNLYYTKSKLVKELAENINKNSPKFSRNFMVYEIIDYNCNFLKEIDCLKGIEKNNSAFAHRRFTNRYIDLKVKLLLDLMAKNKGPNCQGFISETVAKIPTAMENPNFLHLIQQCPGAQIPSTASGNP